MGMVKTGGREARPYAAWMVALLMIVGGQEAAPTRLWAGPRATMEQTRIETGSGLARGPRAQVEAGEIAAWAGNLPPDPPAGLGPAAFTLGDATSTAVAALAFTLSDPDPGDRVGYVVEVSTRGDFGVLVASKTGGQEAAPTRVGTGPLGEGWYWWRVKAVDAMGAASSWSVANGGEAAFAVDDDPPGAVVETPAAGATVSMGAEITIVGAVNGVDVSGWEVAMTTGVGQGGRKARPYAVGTNRQVSVRWTPTGEAGPVTIGLTARDAEGFTAMARVEVIVSTTGRPGGRPYAAPALAEEAFGFRSAGVGPNPARAGAWVSGHLAVGRADAMRARLFTSAGELVTNQEASNPVWHSASGGPETAPTQGELCYEPALETRGLASGVYLLVMEAEKEGQPSVRAVRKLLIIK